MAAFYSKQRVLFTLTALLAATSIASAQSPAPPSATPAVKADTSAIAKPAPPTSPAQAIRNKISAGDLLSAESILEVYRERHGEDGRYCSGLGWLARGAWLLGEKEKARRYAADLRARCADSLAQGAKLEETSDLTVALGAAIEVEAQRIEHEKGAPAASALVREEIGRLEDAPMTLRSRLHKRLNMLSLPGTRAPELELEDWIGDKPPTLASLRGKPVVLFVWAEWCADCKAQAATLARIKSKYGADGLEVLAVSRYYQVTPEKIAAEKARADSVWKADYQGVGTIPMLMSTASMERYGGSSTPTLVFVDRKGVVRDYTPTRLTDAEFEKRVAAILK